VLLFVLLGHVPTVLLLAQLGMLYLTVLDLREEDDLDFQVKVWWFLLVLIFNVVGFLAEKAWIFERRRRRRRRSAGERRRAAR
jgi:predicted CDP-diglyceride synthetase/phosphatidate cytidylyltransferase